MKALRRGVRSGDRRVFYCTNPPTSTLTIAYSDTTHESVAGHSDQMPCKTGSEEDNMDEGEYPQSTRLFVPTLSAPPS